VPAQTWQPRSSLPIPAVRSRSGPEPRFPVERSCSDHVRRHGGQPSCQFRATYYLVNPTGDRAAAIAAFGAAATTS
jgi:hypothetical protein